ncbi:MAG: TRAP transporter substrate-binding protein DctP [bacterium]|nr:TRAP transporter substrate-binding protein DctP [bacterium]
MRLKKWLKTSLFSLPFICPAIGLAGETPVKPEFVLKWATIAPENTIWGDNVYKFSREIEKQSGGRLKNIWYFGAVMGDEPDAIRKMRLDQVQGVALLSVGLSKLIPEMVVFSLPDLFQSYEEVDCVFDRTWPLIEKVFNQRGMVPLGRSDVGFSVAFSKKLFKNLEDGRKAKVWKWAGVEQIEAAAKMFGFENLITLTLPEVMTGLQTGMIDTVYATYYTCIALQWYTQIKYMSDVKQTGAIYAPGMLVLKKESWDKLPEDIKLIMKKQITDSVKPLREQMRKDEAQSQQELIKKGIQMIEFDQAFIDEIHQKAMSVYHDWIGVYYPDWLLQGVLTARNQCRMDLKTAKPAK